MPQMANVVTKDDTNTVITFIPYKGEAEASFWRTNLVGRGNDEAQNTLVARWRKLKDGRKQINYLLRVPVVDTPPTGSVNTEGYLAVPRVIDEVTLSLTQLSGPRVDAATLAHAVRMFYTVLGGGGSSAQSLPTEGEAANTYVGFSQTRPFMFGLIQHLLPMGG